MPFDGFVPSVIDGRAFEYNGEKESNAYRNANNSNDIEGCRKPSDCCCEYSLVEKQKRELYQGRGHYICCT